MTDPSPPQPIFFSITSIGLVSLLLMNIFLRKIEQILEWPPVRPNLRVREKEFFNAKKCFSETNLHFNTPAAFVIFYDFPLSRLLKKLLLESKKFNEFSADQNHHKSSSTKCLVSPNWVCAVVLNR